MSAVQPSPFDWAGKPALCEEGWLVGDQDSVIDLETERRRRRAPRTTSHDYQRQAALQRHPSVRARAFQTPQRQRGALEWQAQTVRKALQYLAALITVIALGAGLGATLRDAPYDGETWVHSVSQGESLWSLAMAVNTGRPVEQVIEDIRQLNGLSDNTLLVGQELVLPAQ